MTYPILRQFPFPDSKVKDTTISLQIDFYDQVVAEHSFGINDNILTQNIKPGHCYLENHKIKHSVKQKPDTIKLENYLIQTAKCDAEKWKVEQGEQHKLKEQ